MRDLVTIAKVELKKLLSRKDTWLMFTILLVPILYSVGLAFESNVITYTGSGSVTAIGFTSAMFQMSQSMFIFNVILSAIIGRSFASEIESKSLRLCINRIGDMAYYGYHRTSTKEQHLDRGIIEIQRFCESQNIKLAGIFTDKLTGKNFDRPRYTVLVEDVLREGDTLIITELDRLGRNKQEILKQLQILKDKGVRVMVLELPTTLIDLSQMDNALARLMIETINNVLIEIYASLAQAEMEKKEKRQREGMEAKKLRGEWDEVGRPRAIEPEKFNQEFLRVIEKEVTPTQLQRELGLTASTFYRYRKDFFEKFPQFVQFQK